MNKISVLLIGLIVAFSSQAAELTQLDTAKSQITFSSKQMGVAVDGRFRKFDAQVSVDPAKVDAGKARIDVDLASIDSGSAEADTEVKGKLWFNTPAFPKASFASSSVKSLGGGRYEAHGTLSIKGISREIVAPFSIRNEGSGAWIEGGFILPRLQFKIGEGEWADTSTVADGVQVKFKLLLNPKK